MCHLVCINTVRYQLCLYQAIADCVYYPCPLTDPLGRDPAAVLGVDDPVVVLECVHGLEHGAYPPDRVIDQSVVQELCRHVLVQLTLDLGGAYKGNNKYYIFS